ncbi:MAG: hypothetical protein ACP5G5_00335 [Thermoplasmata archaeon]|jgi:DNA-binding transcriptional ArsR family regulator|nr:hypothetical protein [Thermoplasmatales archaeon]PMP73439.1 MAG: hypothetical protein C0180_06745 [Aciduliprofundum sp.]HEU12676.1 hypothetical protein [Euryarchaeota archaeon]
MNQKEIYKNLKERIIEILNQDEKSISSISKQLESEGTKIHRLTLTGYLMALRDLNILKEKEIQPSKIYSVNSVEERNIYEIIGEFISDHPESGDLCVYILHQLFRRPILKYEIDRCCGEKPEYAEKVYGDERKMALDILESMGIHVSKNMPAYVPKKEYVDEFRDILIQMVINGYNLQRFVSNKKTQMKIDSI